MPTTLETRINLFFIQFFFLYIKWNHKKMKRLAHMVDSKPGDRACDTPTKINLISRYECANSANTGSHMVFLTVDGFAQIRKIPN